MKIVAEHPLEIGYHTASWSHPTSSEFCGATTFLLQENDHENLITLGIVAKGFGGDSQALRTGHLAGLALRRHFSQSESSDILGLLSDALDKANKMIISQGPTPPEMEETQGVALAAAVLFQDRLYVAIIGNCRVYLRRRGGSLTRITIDHAQPIPTGDEQETALTTPADLERYLGQGPDVEPDFRMRLDGEQSDEEMVENQGAELQPGDTLLLVTDGVTGAVPDTRIERILARDRPEQAARQLTRAALAQPGVQSASALVMRMPESQASAWPWPARSFLRYGAWILLGLLLIAAVAFGAPQGRSPLPTLTPTLTTAPTETMTSVAPVTAKSETPSPTSRPSATQVVAPIYTRPPPATETALPTETPTSTATSSPSPEPSETPTTTPSPTLRRPTATMTPSMTPTVPPPPPRPTKTPKPPPANTQAPPTDPPPPPPTDVPRPTPTTP